MDKTVGYFIRVCEDPELIGYDNGFDNLNAECPHASNTSAANALRCDHHDELLLDINETSAMAMNHTMTQDDLIFEAVHHYIYGVTLPIIFSFGVFGNIMNLVIFTRRRLRSRMSEVEKAATTGLMSLAFADFCFCLVGLLSHFLSPFETNVSIPKMNVFGFYFTSCQRALLNTFLFISTWVITVLSIERWAAATYPFLARRFVDVRRSVLINVGIYVISIIFNIPNFLQESIVTAECTPSCWCYARTNGILRQNKHLNEAYEVIWAIVGTFIPIALLVFCNIRFLMEIHRSRAQFKVDNKKASRRSNASTGSKATLTRITVILVAIIGMFLLLVCPSSVLGFLLSRVNIGDHTYHVRYRIFLVIFNFTQGINFAANFLLYCTMSREFRNTLVKIICRGPKRCFRGHCSSSSPTNMTNNMTEQPSMTVLKGNNITTESRLQSSTNCKEKTEWL